MVAHAPLLWLHLAGVVVREAEAQARRPLPGSLPAFSLVAAEDSILEQQADAGPAQYSTGADAMLLATPPSAAATAAAAVLAQCCGSSVYGRTAAALGMVQLEGLASSEAPELAAAVSSLLQLAQGCEQAAAALRSLVQHCAHAH